MASHLSLQAVGPWAGNRCAHPITGPYLIYSPHLPQVGANLVERGDKALVLNTGYFGDGFTDWWVVITFYFANYDS